MIFLCLSCDYRPSTEPAQVAFTSPESIAVEGDDDVTICLSVISGEVTTPTNITFTTAPPEVPFTDSGAQPRPIIEVPEYSSAFGESVVIKSLVISLGTT